MTKLETAFDFEEDELQKLLDLPSPSAFVDEIVASVYGGGSIAVNVLPLIKSLEKCLYVLNYILRHK